MYVTEPNVELRHKAVLDSLLLDMPGVVGGKRIISLRRATRREVKHYVENI